MSDSENEFFSIDNKNGIVEETDEEDNSTNASADASGITAGDGTCNISSDDSVIENSQLDAIENTNILRIHSKKKVGQASRQIIFPSSSSSTLSYLLDNNNSSAASHAQVYTPNSYSASHASAVSHAPVYTTSSFAASHASVYSPTPTGYAFGVDKLPSQKIVAASAVLQHPAFRESAISKYYLSLYMNFLIIYIILIIFYYL